MIYMQATVDVIPDKVGEFVEFLGKELAPFVDRFGMKLVGSWTNTVGTMFQVIDLWAFESLEHFGRAITAMVRDPEFRKLDSRLRTIITSETTKVLWPLPCSPMR